MYALYLINISLKYPKYIGATGTKNKCNLLHNSEH